MDASAQLAPFRERIAKALLRAERRVTEVTGAFDMDIVVQNMPGRVIPQLGFVGYAPTGWLVHLTFDADNGNLEQNLEDPLERHIAHEANHVLRWRGPGYGQTLGAALISEGLAGNFVREVYYNAPELWERPSPGDLDAMPEVLERWSDSYDHAEWFFGANGRPAWLGYRLGYRIVARHIEKVSRAASALTELEANAFRETAEELAA